MEKKSFPGRGKSLAAHAAQSRGSNFA
jgi:hypothetical protein